MVPGRGFVQVLAKTKEVLNGSEIPVPSNPHFCVRTFSWTDCSHPSVERCSVTRGISRMRTRTPLGLGVLEGVMSAGARIAAVTSVQDLMPGSKGSLILVIIVERQ